MPFQPEKLSALQKRFRKTRNGADSGATERVQKNLSIPKYDAERLEKLANKAKLSQACLLGAALDAYEAALKKPHRKRKASKCNS